MQEWVETLRSKLREMKILSPRENLYTKLPEVRLPLLPTRDPTSPLPAPPPVPAAIVPGVERVIPNSVQQQNQLQNTSISNDSAASEIHNDNESPAAVTNTSSNTSTNDILSNNTTTTATPSTTITTVPTSTITSSFTPQSSTSTPTPLTSMSNTLTQNLLNMLSDPISAYSEQINDANSSSSSVDLDDFHNTATTLSLSLEKDLQFSDSQSTEDECIGPLLRKPSFHTSDLNSFTNNNSVRLDILAHRASAGTFYIF